MGFHILSIRCSWNWKTAAKW